MLNYISPRAMQVKTTVRYRFTPVRMAIIIIFLNRTSAGEDVEKLELLCAAGWNVKWRSHHGKQYGGSSKN